MNRLSILNLFAMLILGACSSTPPVSQVPSTVPSSVSSSARGGGYYLDDGPGDIIPSNLHAIPDAVPRIEPLHRFANRQYVALGQSYMPDTSLRPYREEGTASWYGRRFHGKKTASGELYDMYAMTAAHRTLPIPSYARVTSLDNGKSVVVRINDRGPFHKGRVIDLSFTAAYKLGYTRKGSSQVLVESIDPSGFDIQGMPLKPGHYVQIGAFGNLKNAEKLLHQARESLGLPVEQTHVALVDSLHRVNLGPFQNEDEAGIWADRTRASLGMEAITIVR
jgi:rare lipoprotein A